MSKIVKSSIAKMALKSGYHIFSDWKMLELPLALHLGKLFKKYEIHFVFDVGANRGVG